MRPIDILIPQKKVDHKQECMIAQQENLVRPEHAPKYQTIARRGILRALQVVHMAGNREVCHAGNDNKLDYDNIAMLTMSVLRNAYANSFNYA